MFSGHSKIKLEISNGKISWKSPNIWKPTDTLLNNLWIKDVKREISISS